jgi:hypothetical protein
VHVEIVTKHADGRRTSHAISMKLTADFSDVDMTAEPLHELRPQLRTYYGPRTTKKVFKYVPVRPVPEPTDHEEHAEARTVDREFKRGEHAAECRFFQQYGRHMAGGRKPYRFSRESIRLVA